MLGKSNHIRAKAFPQGEQVCAILYLHEKQWLLIKPTPMRKLFKEESSSANGEIFSHWGLYSIPFVLEVLRTQMCRLNFYLQPNDPQISSSSPGFSPQLWTCNPNWLLAPECHMDTSNSRSKTKLNISTSFPNRVFWKAPVFSVLTFMNYS